MQRALSALVGLLLSTVVTAEQFKQFTSEQGVKYDIHYIAFVSTFLQPEIARQYGLTRSQAIGVLNVSVLKHLDDGKTDAVGAVIEGKVINDIQQNKFLGFQQIIENPAIYYLAQTQFREGEVLTFDLSIFPEGVRQPFKLRFSHTFYND
jgi:hypothetical protein